MKRTVIGLAAAVTLAAGMGSDWIRPTVRPRLQSGLTPRDYKMVEPPAPEAPPTAVGTSLNGVEIVDPGLKKKLKTFALDKTALKSLHCSIAQVAFTFDEDGNWIFNCQADQNPWFTLQANRMQAPGLAGRLNVETNHILRNEFFISVRCIGNSPLKETIKTTGKPALVEIKLPSVWVQRGVPLAVKNQGQNGDLTKFYAVIDRVEFELSFR